MAKAYAMTGLVGGALHTIAVQSNLLKELDLGEAMLLEALLNHRSCAIKQMACATFRSKAAIFVEERHLWLNLSGISLFGLFHTAVNTVVQMFREAKVQLAAFKRFSPHCSHGPLAPNNPADPQPGCRWSKCECACPHYSS